MTQPLVFALMCLCDRYSSITNDSITETNYGENLFDVYFQFLVWFRSKPLTWRRSHLWLLPWSTRPYNIWTTDPDIVASISKFKSETHILLFAPGKGNKTWLKYEVYLPSMLLQCPCRSRLSGVRWDPLDRWCTLHWMFCCYYDGFHNSRWAEKTLGLMLLRRREAAEPQLMLPERDRNDTVIISTLC